jgi:hypothetical protein
MAASLARRRDAPPPMVSEAWAAEESKTGTLSAETRALLTIPT